MELKQVRRDLNNERTISELFMEGWHFCYILEPPYNEATCQREFGGAMPYGRFEIIMEMSDKFKRRMPEIKGVPGRSELKFHIGNFVKDTDGCPLPGLTVDGDSIGYSTAAFDRLCKEILEAEHMGEPIFLEVVPPGEYAGVQMEAFVKQMSGSLQGIADELNKIVAKMEEEKGYKLKEC